MNPGLGGRAGDCLIHVYTCSSPLGSDLRCRVIRRCTGLVDLDPLAGRPAQASGWRKASSVDIYYVAINQDGSGSCHWLRGRMRSRWVIGWLLVYNLCYCGGEGGERAVHAHARRGQAWGRGQHIYVCIHTCRKEYP